MATEEFVNLYIGNFASVDTNESNYTNEGTYPLGTVVDDTTLQFVNVTGDDANSDGVIQSDDINAANGESVTYDLGSGPVTSVLDSAARYEVEFTLADGTVVTDNVFIVQYQNGDAFIGRSSLVDGLAIKSISIGPEVSDNWYGITAGGFTGDGTIVCFASGTLIQTIEGEVAVEDLVPGDEVLTGDNGYRPIRWIGSKTISPKALSEHEKLRPVRIRAGAIGNGLPKSDLFVSQQHRILISSKIAQRMFDGQGEVLVAAKHLVIVDGIDIVETDGVEYFHFLFDDHQIVFSNGIKTESLFTGPEALKAMSTAARQEILTIFPELASKDYKALACRPIVNGKRGRKLAFRHKSNAKALYVETLL